MCFYLLLYVLTQLALTDTIVPAVTHYYGEQIVCRILGEHETSWDLDLGRLVGSFARFSLVSDYH